MNKVEINVENNKNLSTILSDYGFTSINISKFFKSKDILLNGERVKSDCVVKSGDKIIVYTFNMPQKRYEILYEDTNIIILNKFSGIEVVGDCGLEGKIPNSIAVHRLDRNTTGLLVMAKNIVAKNILMNAIKQRTIVKKYYCEVLGKTNFINELVTAYLIKDSKNSVVKIYKNNVASSEKIQTIFNTERNSADLSIVSAQLITGKTHQIRACLSYLSHPILGDEKYGDISLNNLHKVHTQRLHSYYLLFNGLKEPLNYLNGKEFINPPTWF